jgi:Uma2 family endonuclease
MIANRPPITAEDLLKLPDDGTRHDLVRGVLRTTAPAGGSHGATVMPISASLYAYVTSMNLGVVYGAETGFLTARNPDTVLAPDCAFVSAKRVLRLQARTGFLRGAPDLAIEVASPRDSLRSVNEKSAEWMAAGVRMLIVLQPRRRTVTVHRPAQEPVVLAGEDVLDGGDVVPGWRISVAEVFAQSP